MIKVAIVDDHKLFRQGLGVILASKEDIEVVEKYESAIHLLKYLKHVDVDLLLLDIDMPELDGISAMPRILEEKPDIKVLILSMHLSSKKIQEAVAAGVNGYLLKTSDDDEVAQAIYDVMDGKEYFSKEAHSELINSFRQKDDPRYVELTKREKEILNLVCQEFSSQEIAKQLSISIHTAETHRRNLLHKTDCKNSVGLVKYAIENELI